MSNLEVNETTVSYLGIDVSISKELMKINNNPFSCIYLLSLNEVKYLRDSMNISSTIDDNSIVCKYGYTEDIYRRLTEHLCTFNKIKGSFLRLKYYSYIDPRYLSKAESDIKEYIRFEKIQLIYRDMKELIVLQRDQLKMMEKQFIQISKSYIYHISDMLNQLEKERYEKQILKEKYKKKLKKKQIEILQLQLKYK